MGSGGSILGFKAPSRSNLLSRKSLLIDKPPQLAHAEQDDSIVEQAVHKSTTKVDALIIETLRKLKCRSEESKGVNFERIMLKFGVARAAFDRLREIYGQFADSEGLTYTGLKSALQFLGADISEQDVHELFYESDMMRDNTLTVNEFVVSLVIAHLLGMINGFEPASFVHEKTFVTMESSSQLDQDSASLMSKMFGIIISAYMLFDADGSGMIEISEVKNVLKAKTRAEYGGREITSSPIDDERIKELDINKDGTITFQEFVLTFQSWVGTDE